MTGTTTFNRMKILFLLGAFTVVMVLCRQPLYANDDLRTDFNLSGSTIKGSVLNSGGVQVKVENEKDLNDLFSVRKDFKDRVKKSLADGGVKQ